jgi:thiamine-phosphate pyrophosphorylase
VNDGRLVGGLALYLVADPEQGSPHFYDVVGDALDGGVTCVQLRAKELSDRLLYAAAQRLRALCTRASALFIVNDRADIALAAGADGVHLGVDDLPIEAARALGGPDFLIGYSPASDSEAAQAAARGADYLGVGPVYGTKSKSDAGEAIGLETLRRRVQSAGVPVIGIGGISNRNAAQVIGAGAVGIAVVSAILQSEQPRYAATELAEIVSKSLRQS